MQNSVPTARGTLMRKAQRQPKAAVTNPPIRGPPIVPTAITRVTMP